MDDFDDVMTSVVESRNLEGEFKNSIANMVHKAQQQQTKIRQFFILFFSAMKLIFPNFVLLTQKVTTKSTFPL